MFPWLGINPRIVRSRKEELVMSRKSGAMDTPEKTMTISEDDVVYQTCFSPKGPTFRFIGLMLMCLMGFGFYFCYDNPGALQDYFTNDLHISTEKFVMLYSIYSWPNVLMSFIGGFLLDSVFGIRWGSIIYIALATIGQVIFATGAYVNIFWLMIVGRFVFGVGAESLVTAQSKYAVLWFKDKELHMVFGMQLSFARIGSTVNFLTMENIYGYVSEVLRYAGSECLGVVLFFTALTCVASMICIILLGAMDKRAEQVLRRNNNQKEKIMKLQDVKDFKSIFWLVSFTIVTYYIAIFPFLALAKVFFIKKYEFDPAEANTASSLGYLISIVGSPLFGILVDKTGKNICWVILSIIGSLLAHSLMAFTYMNPYVSMVILGLSISLLESSLWPMISLIAPIHQLGTAYGIAQALQNLGLAVAPIICGIIVDKYGYFVLEMVFLLCLFTSLVIAMIVWLLERNDSGDYSVHELNLNCQT